MTDDEIKHEQYKSVRKEGWDIIVGSALSYDKSIISLSTVSLGFVFAISQKPTALTCFCKCTLMLVLFFLILAILCSLLSFWFDQLFGLSLRSQAKQYRKGSDKEFKLRKSLSYYLAMWSKIFSGIFFILSLLLYTIYFCNTYL